LNRRSQVPAAAEPQHAFPGFAEAFKSNWPVDRVAITKELDPVEIDRILHVGNRPEAVHGALDLLVGHIIREHNRLENRRHLLSCFSLGVGMGKR
jgi:hypothetical protein